MVTGRPKKPTALHVLNGNPSKLNLKSKTEPKPQKDMPKCPKYLSKDKDALEEWNRIVPELYRIGLLTLVDRAALELYCSQYSVYKSAFIEIQKNGLTTKNIRNGEKALPQLAIAREAAKIIKAIAVEFGLTPSSRGRISMPNEKSIDSEFEDLID